MARWSMLAVLAALLALVAVCQSQGCPSQAFAGNPDYCLGRIEYDVFVPSGLNQTALADSLSLLTKSAALIPDACRNVSFIMGCSKAFRELNCTTGQVIPVCRRVCDDFNALCPPLFPPCSETPLCIPVEDCDQDDPFNPGSPLFALPGQECTDASGEPDPDVTLSCGELFVLDPAANECKIQCPPPGFDDPHYQKIYQVGILVLSSVSLVSLALLLATGIATWDKRRMHAYYHIAALFIQTFGVWIGKWLSYAEWMCVNDWKVRDQSSTAGALQAALVLYGTLAAAVWNLLLVYQLFNRISENRFNLFGPDRLFKINGEIVYNILGWGLIPIPFMIAMFAGDFAKNGTGWIMLPDVQALDGWIFPILYLVPISVLAVIQFVLMGWLFWYIARLAGIRGIQSQVRLLVLCIHYAVRVAIGLGYSWDQLAKKEDTRKEITDYVLCVRANSTATCTDLKPPYVGGPGGVLNGVLVASAGLIILLIFTDIHIVKLWIRWVRCKGFSDSSATGSTSLAEEHSGSRY